MSEIKKLIERLCPEGVEYRTLLSITKSVKTGLNPRKNFKLNTSDAQNYYVTVKEFTSGKIVFSDKTDMINDQAIEIIQGRSNLEEGDVLFSGIGTIGKVALVDIPTDNWNVSESVFLIKPIKEIINSKFLLYVLGSDIVKNQYKVQSVGSTLKGVRMSTLNSLEIPVPPLEAQLEIVKLLDDFTDLETELEAKLEEELKARQKQYEYYRNQLFSFENKEGQNVKWMALGEIGEMIKGSGIQKSDFIESGCPCIHYGQLHTYFGTFADKNITFIKKELYDRCKKAQYGDLIIASTSEDVEACCKATAWLGSEIAISGDAHIFHHTQNPKYVAYFFQTDNFASQKRKYASGVKVVRINSDNLSKISIPIPPLEEQERIASLLENIDTFTTNLQSCLTAEIEARRKQYDYYREKLLTFKRKSA